MIFFFQVNSIFDMKKPYDLVGFLEQEKRVEQLESLKELLADTSSLDSVAERHEPDLEDRFYNNDLVNLHFLRFYTLKGPIIYFLLMADDLMEHFLEGVLRSVIGTLTSSSFKEIFL